MKLRYERGALADLEAILAYIAADNPKAAARLVARIEDTARRIAENPYLGEATRRSLFRRFPVGNYLIVYEVGTDEVVIHTTSVTARDDVPGRESSVVMPQFTGEEMESGRRLFAGDWHFVSAAGSAASLPSARGIEIAFAGRSNVGKSSLINALVGRKALARTSDTPGRTQELIYFGRDGVLSLVDMPGYGFARAPKGKVKAWTDLIHAYLRGRANLARVYVLIDARHGLKATDRPVLDTLDEAAVSYAIVLAKADLIEPGALVERVSTVSAGLAMRPAAFPDVLVTSARTGAGIEDLRAAIARVLAERAVASA